MELCIGGILGRLADAIGWGSCANLATIAYYPFINKMHIALSLPIFIPPPLGVSAGLEAGSGQKVQTSRSKHLKCLHMSTALTGYGMFKHCIVYIYVQLEENAFKQC